MRYLITLILLQSFFTGHTQIVINGQIKNYDGKSKIYYTPTIEGVLFTTYELIPSPTGNFRIKYNNEGYGTCRVYFNSISFSFIHTSKTEIRFSIDQSKINISESLITQNSEYIRDSVKQIATNYINGDFAEINRFNNKEIRTSTRVFTLDGCSYSQLVKDAETPEKVIHIIDSLILREIDQIKKLEFDLKVETMNALNSKDEMTNFLLNQVYSFYANVFLNGMMLKQHEQGRRLLQEPKSSSTIYNATWDNLIDEYFRNASKNIKPAANTFEYNELVSNMAYMNDPNKYDPLATSEDELVIERLLKPKLSKLDSLSLLDENGIFAFKLFNLSRFLQTQTFYSPVLLNSFNELKLKYPNSLHIAKFELQIESLKKYLKSNAMQFEKALIIETKDIKFENLLSKFIGKNLLIDIWATWCGPCIEDFNYKSKLKPFIEAGEISILYISIDKPVWERKWKENMKYNQLEGYHVLANDILIEDLWNYLGGTQGAIPRYALIDKNGKVFMPEASRPSQGDKLIEQIKALLMTK